MVTGLKSVRNRHDDALSRVSWDRLESMLAEYYRREGYVVEHVGTGGTGHKFDGGIDLKLRKDDAYIIVQSKHWNAMQVPHNAVHELLGVMVNEGATGAILVTSGEFTRAAIEAATKQGHVQLVDGDDLRAMLGPLPELMTEPGPVQRGKRGDAAKSSFTPVMKWLLSTAALLLIALAVFQFIKATILKIPQHQQARMHATQQAAAQASQQSFAPPMPPVQSQATTPITASCRELIDSQSGTYIDHCAQSAPTHTPTAAEIRESQRKADEAMKVIEANTPDM